MIHNDLNILSISHPPELTRDTGTTDYAKRRTPRGNSPKVALRYLAKELLGRDIQIGVHESVEDAQATMEIYRLIEEEYENDMKLQ